MTTAESGKLGRAYWGLCTAVLASSLGDGAALVGFPLLVSTLTHDPRLLAGVAVAQRLPWLLLSLFTGTVADRVDRKRFIGGVELSRMVIVSLLGAAVAGHFHPLAVIYLSAFLLGTFQTAFSAASGALIPELVGRERSVLGRANGYVFAAQQAGEGVVGAAVGGLLAAVALALPFLFDGATFAVSAAVILVVLTPLSARAASDDERSVLSGMAEGMRWFLRDRAVRVLAGFIACLAFGQAAVMSVLVLWAERYLHTTRFEYGALISLAALGWVGGALLAGRGLDRLAPVPLLSLAGAVAGLTYIGLGITTSLAVAAAVLFIEGVAVSVGNVLSSALRQTLIPAGLLGRVGNATRTFIYGAMPLGAVAGGFLARAFGFRTTFVVAGAFQLGVVVLVARLMARALAKPFGGTCRGQLM